MSDYIKKHRINPTPPKTERNTAMVKAHEVEGLSYSQLAIIYGLTPQRCQQICKTYGTKKGEQHDVRN